MEKFTDVPAYHHDCGECTYLGTLSSAENGLRDFYSCDETLIVRHSSSAPDYDAMPTRFAGVIGGDYARAQVLLMARDTNIQFN